MKMKLEWLGRVVVVTTAIVTLTNCGKVTNNQDDAYEQAQKTAEQWYSAFEKNAVDARGAVAQQPKQLSVEEIQDRVLHVINYLENAQAQSVKSAVTNSQAWTGRYGGQNTYKSGTTSNGGYFQVKSRYNPNIQSQGGTATGGGIMTYNGPNGAGAAGIHVGIAGVCGGAAVGSKASMTGTGCGGCVSWGGQAYGGCF